MKMTAADDADDEEEATVLNFVAEESETDERDTQGWTDMYTLVVPSLSAELIKNSYQKLPI